GLRANAFHANIPQLLDGAANVLLIRLGVNLERVGIKPLREQRSLLRHQRTKNHLIGVQLDVIAGHGHKSSCFNSWWTASIARRSTPFHAVQQFPILTQPLGGNTTWDA